MGSVRDQLENRKECSVVVVGDSKVGKTALINRFVHDDYTENYRPTNFSKQVKTTMVANRRVRYTVWDTCGAEGPNSTRNIAYREADIFLLCYNICDPPSLFSAINHWVPDLRCHAPNTPIVLVGCQADLRTDTLVANALSQLGKSPVSSDQALAFSRQIEAVMYVETSAKSNGRTPSSAFEVAALACLGQFTRQASILSTTSAISPLNKTRNSTRNLAYSSTRDRDLHSSIRHRDLSVPRIRESDPASTDLYHIEPTEAFWEQFQLPKISPRNGEESPRHGLESPRSPCLNPRSKLGSLSSMSVRSKSSTLSSTKSDTSMLSVSTTTKTPRASRRFPEKDREKMITIKCQRLTADKTYEEVEIEVPAPVYENMQAYGDHNSIQARNNKEKKTLGNKLKSLFAKI